MTRGIPPWLIEFVKAYVINHGLQSHDVLFGETFNGCLIDRVLSYMKFNPIHRQRIFAATKFNGNWDEVKSMLEM